MRNARYPLLFVGKNYVGFVPGYSPSQGEADGVLFKNVKLGELDFTSFAPNVEWVECNDRDPVGLPLLRWKYRLANIPTDPVLSFDYAGAETDSTGVWTWDTLLAHLPATGGDQVFHHYEIKIDKSLLTVGDNYIGFVSGYIPDQEEADGILLRNVELVDMNPQE